MQPLFGDQFVMSIRRDDTSAAAVGERIRAVMEARNLTEAILVKEHGFQYNELSQWLNGKHVPSLPKAFKLCDVLGITETFLFRGRTEGLDYELGRKLAA